METLALGFISGIALEMNVLIWCLLILNHSSEFSATTYLCEKQTARK